MEPKIYKKKFKTTINPKDLIDVGFAKGWNDGEYRIFKDGLIAETDLNSDRSINVFDAGYYYPGNETKDTIFEFLKSIEYMME